MHNLQKIRIYYYTPFYKFQRLVVCLLQDPMRFFQTRRNVPEDKGNCDSGCLSEEIMSTASYTSALVVCNITGKFVSHTPQ